jgi:(R,R)-butanediol dehydrogenase / meso-butanediol dehydrogenase / diacetyl reductase
MRTAIFRGANLPLEIQTVPDPTPQPHEVVLKVGRCGICGTDLSMTSAGSINYEPGSALGHEFAGEIVALGDDVERLQIGDRVAVVPVESCGHCRACLDGEPFFCPAMRPRMGGFGEYARAPQSSCFLLSPRISFAEGAIVEPLAVGAHAIDVGNIRPGQDVLILGSGAVALAMAFWARRRGAVTVTMAARSARNQAIASVMGVTQYVSLDDLAREKTFTAQTVIECIGVPGVLAKALEHVKPRGTVIVSGLCLKSDSIIPGLSVFKEVRIQMAVGYSIADFTASLDAVSADPAIPRNMISESILLEQLPQRFEALRTERHACKVLVDPSSRPPGGSTHTVRS